MNYINTTTGEYPVTESMIRLAYPNTSFPVPFQAPEEYALVFQAPQPAHDPLTQRVQAIAPELTELGHWEQRWEVVELFDTQTEKDEAIAAAVEAKRLASIPQAVTMRQARLALLGAGLLTGVATAIAALPSPQKEAATIEWEYSQTVERNRGFVLLLGAALGLDDAQLDTLFITAAGL